MASSCAEFQERPLQDWFRVNQPGIITLQVSIGVEALVNGVSRGQACSTYEKIIDGGKAPIAFTGIECRLQAKRKSSSATAEFFPEQEIIPEIEPIASRIVVTESFIA